MHMQIIITVWAIVLFLQMLTLNRLCRAVKELAEQQAKLVAHMYPDRYYESGVRNA